MDGRGAGFCVREIDFRPKMKIILPLESSRAKIKI